MVRLVQLWFRLYILPYPQAPSRPRREQVHLVRLNLQRFRLHL